MFYRKDIDLMFYIMKLINDAISSDPEGIPPLMVTDERLAFQGVFGEDLDFGKDSVEDAFICNFSRTTDAHFEMSTNNPQV